MASRRGGAETLFTVTLDAVVGKEVRFRGRYISRVVANSCPLLRVVLYLIPIAVNSFRPALSVDEDIAEYGDEDDPAILYTDQYSIYYHSCLANTVSNISRVVTTAFVR